MNNFIPAEIVSYFDHPLRTEALISATNDIEAINTWLGEYKNNSNTLISYRQCVERYYLWLHYRGQKLAEVSREDLQNYQDFLANPTPKELWCGPRMAKSSSNWKPFVKGLTASSLRLQFWILRNLYTYLVAADYLVKNPFLLIKKLPKVIDKGIDRVFVKRQIDYILNFIHQLPDKTADQRFDKEQALWLIKLLFLSGMRLSEVANAKMRDFTYKREQWWLQVIGKGNKYGEIPATNDLIEALSRYRNFFGLEALPSGFEEQPLIMRKRGNHLKHLSANMLHKIFKRILADTAAFIEMSDQSAAYLFNKASVHWLRHSSATYQIELGVDVVTVKENLRHSNLDTTMRYVHKDKTSRHKETNKKFKL